ncbi:AAA family ATPase [Thermaerobacter sp. PB12/4term]|uniref:AAA family ATPase n=1 Tax=Thermaerobacter sp. PB12/4term TaxID=2293838 RepID=UPI000E326A97|nr:AAA family ATPase [Thermaerobacter sp. PB12/4term]QIA27164.1 AAA family ATPase [Thermaerobacter sp. PB12/4term]
MQDYASLIRHEGNRQLFEAVEMSIIAQLWGEPLHLHAEGVRGTGKTTILRAARRILPRIERIRGCPYNCDPQAPHCPLHAHWTPDQIAAHGTEWIPMPFREISPSAKVGTVTGSLDLGRLTDPGRPEAALLPGTLAQAHRGIVLVDEINRLADVAPELADCLLDVMGTKPGRLQIEETGLPPVEIPVRVAVWAASNPDEEPGPLEEIRRQLSDRFDLVLDVRRPGEPWLVKRILLLGEARTRALAEAARAAWADTGPNRAAGLPGREARPTALPWQEAGGAPAPREGAAAAGQQEAEQHETGQQETGQPGGGRQEAESRARLEGGTPAARPVAGAGPRRDLNTASGAARAAAPRHLAASAGAGETGAEGEARWNGLGTGKAEVQRGPAGGEVDAGEVAAAAVQGAPQAARGLMAGGGGERGPAGAGAVDDPWDRRWREAAAHRPEFPEPLLELLAEIYVQFRLESLRALEAWRHGAALYAARAGRRQVLRADVLEIAPAVLRHRVEAGVLSEILEYLARAAEDGGTRNDGTGGRHRGEPPGGEGGPAPGAGPGYGALPWQAVPGGGAVARMPGDGAGWARAEDLDEAGAPAVQGGTPWRAGAPGAAGGDTGPGGVWSRLREMLSRAAGHGAGGPGGPAAAGATGLSGRDGAAGAWPAADSAAGGGGIRGSAAGAGGAPAPGSGAGASAGLLPAHPAGSGRPYSGPGVGPVRPGAREGTTPPHRARPLLELTRDRAIRSWSHP